MKGEYNRISRVWKKYPYWAVSALVFLHQTSQVLQIHQNRVWGFMHPLYVAIYEYRSYVASLANTPLFPCFSKRTTSPSHRLPFLHHRNPRSFWKKRVWKPKCGFWKANATSFLEVGKANLTKLFPHWYSCIKPVRFCGSTKTGFLVSCIRCMLCFTSQDLML